MTSVTKQQKIERTRLQLPPCADLLSIEQETWITKPLEERSGRRRAMTKTKGKEPRRRLKKRPRRQPEKAAAAAGGSVATATGDGATTAARGSTAADRGGRD
jgi:hypothetical protein